MPKITTSQGRVLLEVDQFDGGWNTKNSPSTLDLHESPDCKNVIFDDIGSVGTRDGTKYLNSVAIGSVAIDGGAQYKNSHVVFAGGNMYHMTASVPTLVTASSGKFTAGRKIAKIVYQNMLIVSDGVNGPYRYEGGVNDFYNLGIGVASACTTSGVTLSGTGLIAPGTYYYRIAFVNSHVVEGQMGSATAGKTLAASANIHLVSIPVGSGLNGVARRVVYRASTVSGPWRYVTEIADNTTTVYTDAIANELLGDEGIEDATTPTPFQTVQGLGERLFFPDSSEKTLVRYTDFENPFVSQAENFIPLQKGDDSEIQRVDESEGFIVAFKHESIWAIDLTDPSDDTTWQLVKTPATMGIIGPFAAAKTDQGIVFAGKRNNKITGFHLLSGLSVSDTADTRLRTDSISERIENHVLAWPSSLVDDIFMFTYDNRVYVACPTTSSSTTNDQVLWFDINRIGVKGQPGSWSPWNGSILKLAYIWEYDGTLFAGLVTATGRVIQFNAGQYLDADGSAIDSYFWTKQYGGENGIDTWQKDGRLSSIWYALLGNWFMNLKYRIDGDTGDGTAIQVNLNPGGSLWGTMVLGVDPWGGGASDKETTHSLGATLGKRFQFGFDNQNTANQGFKVHLLKFFANLRREIGYIS